MSFNQMRIQTKLVLFSLVIVLIGVVALGVTISNTMKISDSAKEIAAETDEASRLADFETTLAEMKIAERDFLLTGDPAFLDIREDHEHHALEKLNEATEATATGSHEHHALEGLLEQLEAEESFHHVVELYQSGKRQEALQLYSSQNGVESHDEHGDGSGLVVNEVISQVCNIFGYHHESRGQPSPLWWKTTCGNLQSCKSIYFWKQQCGSNTVWW